MTVEEDFESTLKAKTDQINAADMLGKPPIIVTIAAGTKVKPGDDQPMTIPLVEVLAYRPCKNMRRALKAAWGLDYRTWAGRQMEIFCDPEAKYGKVKTGGLRIGGLTDIPDDGITLALQWRKGETSTWKIRCIKRGGGPAWTLGVIHPSWDADQPAFVADLATLGLTVEKVDQYLQSEDGAGFRKWWNGGDCAALGCSWVPTRWRAGLTDALKKKPELVAKIATLTPSEQGN